MLQQLNTLAVDILYQVLYNEDIQEANLQAVSRFRKEYYSMTDFEILSTVLMVLGLVLMTFNKNK